MKRNVLIVLLSSLTVLSLQAMEEASQAMVEYSCLRSSLDYATDPNICTKANVGRACFCAVLGLGALLSPFCCAMEASSACVCHSLGLFLVCHGLDRVAYANTTMPDHDPSDCKKCLGLACCLLIDNRNPEGAHIELQSVTNNHNRDEHD